MQAIFDWSSIRRLPGSFVNSGLRERHTDLLFQVQTTLGVVLIYILLEHQSGDDRRMPLRSACYMDRIWEAFDREHPAGPLPVILPLVITHSPNGWTAPRSFHELFDPQVLEFGPPLMRHVPSFDLIIDDLSRTSDDDLASRSLANSPKSYCGCSVTAAASASWRGCRAGRSSSRACRETRSRRSSAI